MIKKYQTDTLIESMVNKKMQKLSFTMDIDFLENKNLLNIADINQKKVLESLEAIITDTLIEYNMSESNLDLKLIKKVILKTIENKKNKELNKLNINIENIKEISIKSLIKSV